MELPAAAHVLLFSFFFFFAAAAGYTGLFHVGKFIELLGFVPFFSMLYFNKAVKGKT